MIGPERTWVGKATARRNAPRVSRHRETSQARRRGIRISVHPIRWARGAPIAVATILLSLAVLIYLVQVNRASWFEFSLRQATVQQTKLNAISAHLLVQKDALLAESRIDSIATSKLHMQHPSLSTALWLKVSVPAAVPQIPRSPTVQTGPLNWMRQTIHAIEESL